MITVRSNQWVGVNSLPPDAVVTLPLGAYRYGDTRPERDFTIPQIHMINQHHGLDALQLGYVPEPEA